MSSTGAQTPRVLSFPATSEAKAWHARPGSDLNVAYLVTSTDMTRLRSGFAYIEPGGQISFSFEEKDPRVEGVRHVGYLDEIYCILSGEAELSWEGGSARAGAGQIVHLPRGGRYKLRVVGDARVTLGWASVHFGR